MKRNFSIFVLVFIALTAFAAQAAPPNVVLIISDDQAWTDYSFMGHDKIATPNLDRLASQSVVFTRGYVPDSLCRPSLMTMITGLYPHQHKISGNDPPRNAAGQLTDRNEMLRHVNRLPTLPKMLAEKDYLSLQTGKWWEGNYKLGGFTHGMTHGDPSGKPRGRHGDLGLSIGREGLKPIADFLDECGERPFFLWYAPFLPHAPHNPPERFFNKYKDRVDSPHVARYYAMCEWFDETCGELLAMLDERKLSANTLVVYVTDNGWIQDPNAPRYAARSKRSQYDGGLRTPIMLRWPGKLTPKRDDRTLVSSIDLAPTILAATGLEPRTEMPGLNLLDVASGKAPQRDAIFGEIFEHDEADIDHPAASLLHRWCIAGDMKLIVSHAGGEPELFDVVDDPFEQKNLASSRPEEVTRLQKLIDAWWSP